MSSSSGRLAFSWGPEGGWSEEELRSAEEAGLSAARLGPITGCGVRRRGMVAVARAQAVLERAGKKLQA